MSPSRTLRLSWCAVGLALFLVAADAKADVIRKSFMKKITFHTLKPNHGNGDYLNKVEKPKVKDDSINTFLFSGETGKKMQNDYLSIEQKNEMRHNHGLNSMSDQIRFNEENKSILKNSLNGMAKTDIRNSVRDSFSDSYKRDYNAGQSRKKRALEIEKERIAKAESSAAGSDVQNLSGTTKSKKPELQEDQSVSAEEVLTFIYQAQTGTNITITDSAEARLRTDTLKGNYNLGVNTDLVESDVHYRSNPIDPLSRDRLGEKDERVSVGLKRPIREVRASTFSRYGLLQRNLTYGLDKEIVEHVSANVTRNESFQSRQNSETTYGVNFSLNF